MTRYEILLFLHIVGAIVWIGIGLTGQALLVWAHRKQEWAFGAKLQEAFSGIEAPAGIFGPLLGLVTGIWLVVDGPWGFSDTWVIVGLVGFGAALALGVGFQAPGLKQFDAIVRERGPEDPEAIALAQRLNALMWPELAILAVVLLAMATKPTGAGSASFWIVTSAALVAGFWVAGSALRRSTGGPKASSAGG